VKSFKVTPGYHRSLYVEATSPKEIRTSLPPSHRSVVREIALVPAEEVPSLYSPREVYASAFWVRVKRGIYNNDIGYVLSRDEDKLDILVAPRQRPYDDDRRQLLFDIDRARRAGCTVTVEQPSDARGGVVTCRGLVYHQGLLLRSFSKRVLEVVEVPHPDSIAFHVLAGIHPSLIRQTILMFSAQLWRQDDLVRIVKGDLRDRLGRIISVDLENQSATIDTNSDGDDGEAEVFACPIFDLQREYRRGDWVKIFAGDDRGVEGCVLYRVDEMLTLSACRHGERNEVRAKCLTNTN